MSITAFNEAHKAAIMAMFDFAHRVPAFTLAYPASLILCLVMGIFLWRRAANRRWVPAICLLIYSAVGNYFITWKVQTADPAMPAWYYPFWQWTGPEPIAGLVLLDIVFYLATAFLTAGIAFTFIGMEGRRRDFKKPQAAAWISLSVLAMSSVAMFACTGLFGQINSIYYALPAAMLTLHLIVRRALHVRIFLSFICVIAAIGFFWNLLLVDLLPLIGWKWAVSWTYVLESGGAVLHSNVFMDKLQYPFMWVMNSPLEVALDMSLKGGWLAFVLIKTILLTLDEDHALES